MRYFLSWKYIGRGMICAGLFLFVSTTAGVASFKKTIPEIDRCRQLILVTAPNWNSVSVTVHYFERASPAAPWRETLPPCNANAGRNGMAWGIGLHGTPPAGEPMKHEGDGRAPAGVFRLQTVFGYTTPRAAGITKFPYVQLTASSEGVDDIHSRYYNRVVDSSRIRDRDWKSSEKMLRPDGLYFRGIIVEHNRQCLPGSGSCIFLHIWLGPGRGTAGCTAMALPDLTAIINRLDESKHPLLIQLPAVEYERWKDDWHLPLF